MSAWEDELTLMVRILANDTSAIPRNTDAYIQQVIVTAGILVDADIDFIVNYTFDVTDTFISPDPIAMLDQTFRALVPLKAACIIQTGDFQDAIGQGIKVRDGDSAIDTSVKFRGFKDILTLGVCKSYELLKWQIQATGSTTGKIGGVALSPYRGPDVIGLDTISWFFDRFALNLDPLGNRRTR